MGRTLLCAMDSITLQINAHRIGGADTYRERVWAPWTATAYPHPTALTTATLHGFTNQSISLRVDLARWSLVRPALWSAEAALWEGETGRPVGPPRPVLLSTLPCDVPLYSTHIGTDPDQGVYSLGLRIPRSAWTPADVETAAEAAEAVTGPHPYRYGGAGNSCLVCGHLPGADVHDPANEAGR